MELQQPDGSYEVVTIPDGLRVGDRFDVDVSEGSRTRGTWEVSDDEAKCLDLRFTVRIIAGLELLLTILSCILALLHYFPVNLSWMAIWVIGTIAGVLGAQQYNLCLVITYCFFQAFYIGLLIVMLIVIPVEWSNGKRRGSDAGDVGGSKELTGFIVYNTIQLLVRVWILYMTYRFARLLSAVGEARARKLDRGNAYKQRCLCCA